MQPGIRTNSKPTGRTITRSLRISVHRDLDLLGVVDQEGRPATVFPLLELESEGELVRPGLADEEDGAPGLVRTGPGERSEADEDGDLMNEWDVGIP